LTLDDEVLATNAGGQRWAYDDAQFDLIVGNQMWHMTADSAAWVSEAFRVLKREGLLAIITRLVPGSRRRGKKAQRLREAGAYINAWCRLRDRRHAQYLSQEQWEDLLMEQGFKIENWEVDEKRIDFDSWTADPTRSVKDYLRLKAMLIQAPEKAREFLTPEFAGDRIRFRLPEASILAKSKANEG
jgi:SAM-dependent methyltransferase